MLKSEALPLSRPLTVLIVDDHGLIRSVLNQMLTSQPEVERVVIVGNYTEAEAQAAKLHPEIIWLDLHIGHAQGQVEIGRLRQLAPASHIIALADVEDEQEAFAAILAGAQGYRSKQDVELGEIMPIIQMLCRDEIVLRPALLTQVMRRLRAAALPLWGSENRSDRHPFVRTAASTGLEELTEREREILQLVSQGYRDREIAAALHISEKTVQKHMQSILSKLDVENRTEAAYLIHSQSVL